MAQRQGGEHVQPPPPERHARKYVAAFVLMDCPIPECEEHAKFGWLGLGSQVGWLESAQGMNSVQSMNASSAQVWLAWLEDCEFGQLKAVHERALTHLHARTRTRTRTVRQRALERCQTEEDRQLANAHVHIVSENNFPTAAGLASSASGYACLGMWRERRVCLHNLALYEAVGYGRSLECVFFTSTE